MYTLLDVDAAGWWLLLRPDPVCLPSVFGSRPAQAQVHAAAQVGRGEKFRGYGSASVAL